MEGFSQHTPPHRLILVEASRLNHFTVRYIFGPKTFSLVTSPADSTNQFRLFRPDDFHSLLCVCVSSWLLLGFCQCSWQFTGISSALIFITRRPNDSVSWPDHWQFCSPTALELVASEIAGDSPLVCSRRRPSASFSAPGSRLLLLYCIAKRTLFKNRCGSGLMVLAIPFSYFRTFKLPWKDLECHKWLP